MADPKKGVWSTPDGLYLDLHKRYNYTFDAAADATNTKVKGAFFTEEDDALKQIWTGRVFCNPPYGLDKPLPQTEDWIQYGRSQVDCGTADLVTLLVPLKADTNFFHDYIEKGLVLLDTTFTDYRGKLGRFQKRLDGDLLVETFKYRQRISFGGGSGWFASVAVTYQVAKSWEQVMDDEVTAYMKGYTQSLRDLRAKLTA